MVTSTRLPLARQSVVDAGGRRVGYELLFRGEGAAPGGPGWDAAAQDRATSAVISAAFGGLTPGPVGEGGLVFLNLTRSFLLGEVPLPVRPEGVVLEVLEDVPVDDALREGLVRLRGEGYVLALDDYVGDDERLALVPLVDVVKVDVEAARAAGRTPADVAARVRLVSRDVRLLAERVEGPDDVEECAAAGYTWFQGFWFDRPRVVDGVALSPSQVVCARLLALLGEPDASARAVERLVQEDPALGLRVLRWVGSAGSGARTPVRSVSQALVLLGPRALRSWVVVALLGASSSSADPLDDVVRVLARARACELLAPERCLEGELYTVGLLSAVSDTTDAPVEQLVRETGLGPVGAAALLTGTGPVGPALVAVRALEGGHPWPSDGDGEGPGAAAVAAAHLEALAWATRTARGLTGAL
ncbi:EAL and HDOD domain-containing protein [uncultured Pseudokineococcus sp.]|uniref:EAL and HDOD domain-containing protein n=1 Tax=uncultured Pseudokineococcus sp. TaxID=1642928 RepID=UPI00262DA473|nr:HDOD domain-containing protein [uncultured Pseudokineococcus sp.]